MSGPISRVPVSILRDLTSQMSQSAFGRASLEAAASKMKVSLGEFLVRLAATRGEVGTLTTTRLDTAAKLARGIYQATGALECAPELAALQHAAGAAAAAGETAAGGASAVGMGARALGFFGRVGSLLGLAGTTATVVGAIATGVVVGGLVIGGAQLAGSMSGDSATAQYGDAANATREGVRPGAVDPGKGDEEPFAAFLMTNVSGGSIWVGQESRLKASLTCNFNGGGNCANNGGADIPVTYQKMSSDYFTFESAVTDYCASLDSDPVNWDLQWGTKAKVYGGDYWIDTAPGCP